MLPPPGAAASQFVPLVTRTSNALAPLSSAVTARSMRFEGNALVMEIEPGEPGLAGRVRDAMRAAGVGFLRITRPVWAVGLLACGAMWWLNSSIVMLSRMCSFPALPRLSR